MSVSETDEVIEFGFGVAAYVLVGLFIISGVFLTRGNKFWRGYRVPIVATVAVTLVLSLGIIGYFGLMLYVIDRSKSPVNYIPFIGYECSGLFVYGFLALAGLAISLALLLRLMLSKARLSIP